MPSEPQHNRWKQHQHGRTSGWVSTYELPDGYDFCVQCPTAQEESLTALGKCASAL